ncbi:MAG: hypothetical protein ACI9J3_001414 [Parvicellaceae bacterium]|jgi:hypothetical protein
MKFIILLLLTLTLSFNLHSQETNWTCIDTTGKEVFTIKAKWIFDYSAGLAQIQKYELINKRWVPAYGFINRKGEIVIPCIYQEVKNFATNVTWVKKRGSETYTLINQQGETIKTKPYKKVGVAVPGFTDRLAVYENGAMGFIDRAGNEVVECKYRGSVLFYEGLCCVSLYGKEEGDYGFIDTSGKVIIPLTSKQGGTSSFHNGFCRSMDGGRTVLINRNGKVVFRPKHGSFQGFNMGRGAVSTKRPMGGWGFINWKNEMVFGGDYDHVNSFDDDGYATVEKDGLVGLVDTMGVLILPMKYRSISLNCTDAGYYCAVYPSEGYGPIMNAKKDYFLKNFEPLPIKVKYLGMADGGSLIMYADLNGKIGFLNRKGEIVIPATYNNLSGFSEGLAWLKK